MTLALAIDLHRVQLVINHHVGGRGEASAKDFLLRI